MPCLQELMSRNVPYREYRKDVQVVMAMEREELPNLSNLSLNASIAHLLPKLCQICRGCWALDPRKRLTMTEITSLLSESCEASAIFLLAFSLHCTQLSCELGYLAGRYVVFIS